jgi:ABC-2 type transport system permease protein
LTPAGAREQRVVAPRSPVANRLRELWRYRELLVGLVRKELKVKYKNSVLGFMWSMLNPALTLVVFYVVFQLVLRAGIPYFAIYLLSGLLVWNLFSSSLPAATTSVVANAALVKKVAFPREILALASVGAGLVHFFLQALVLVGALIVFRYAVSPTYLVLVPFALLVLVVFLSALGILLAAVNVYLRDTQHLIELALLAWFWMTPIVYQYRLVADRLGERSWLVFLNPITAVTLSFQRAIYNRVDARGPDGTIIHILPAGAPISWYATRLAIVGAASVVLLLIALKVFGRLEGNFAEEL